MLSTSLSYATTVSAPVTVERAVTVCASRVDRDDFLVHAGIEPEPVEELLGGLEREIVLVLDQPADEVGEAAVREGHVARAFEDRDLRVVVQPPQARGGRHPARDTADDHHLQAVLGPRTFRHVDHGTSRGAARPGPQRLSARDVGPYRRGRRRGYRGPVADKKRWEDFTPAQKTAIVIGAAAELVVTSIALRDLVRRPSRDVRGPKLLWFLGCFVQPVGAPLYLMLGRRRGADAT